MGFYSITVKNVWHSLRLNCLGKITHRLEPQFWRWMGRFQQHFLYPSWQFPRDKIVRNSSGKLFIRLQVFKWITANERFKKRDAQRVNIYPRIILGEAFSQEHLRRHVNERSHVAIGDAEITDLDVISICEENILRLDVVMNNSSLVHR